MPVQIKVNFASGDTIVTLFNDEQSQDFQFEVSGNPASINFDPGNWILKTLQSLTEVEDITQFHYNIVLSKIILIHSILLQQLNTAYLRVDLSHLKYITFLVRKLQHW
jgi:hypothetical protein